MSEGRPKVKKAEVGVPKSENVGVNKFEIKHPKSEITKWKYTTTLK
jgi:hypothetical protein